MTFLTTFCHFKPNKKSHKLFQQQLTFTTFSFKFSFMKIFPDLNIFRHVVVYRKNVTCINIFGIRLSAELQNAPEITEFYNDKIEREKKKHRKSPSRLQRRDLNPEAVSGWKYLRFSFRLQIFFIVLRQK